MSQTRIHLRAETKAMEKRAGITPKGVAQLVDKGFEVVVEESRSRVFSEREYAAAGAKIVSSGSWRSTAADAIVFGLKDLPDDGSVLQHRHIMFGHAFKGQPDAQALLERFQRGGGSLYDLEYLVDESGKRLAAFGYWAGYAGAAVALLAFASVKANIPMPDLTVPRLHRDELKEEVKEAVDAVAQKPSALIIGMGRTGSGAAELLSSLSLSFVGWDLPETASGGPFPEILAHDVFLNCVVADDSTPVFLDRSAFHAKRRLAVIGDIACDPGSDHNPIPIYETATSFAKPAARVCNDPPLDVTAIDNLPSLLPLESSQDFEAQLLPHLLNLDNIDEGVWKRAFDTFRRHLPN